MIENSGPENSDNSAAQQYRKEHLPCCCAAGLSSVQNNLKMEGVHTETIRTQSDFPEK
jgi:hypothetical protein